MAAFSQGTGGNPIRIIVPAPPGGGTDTISRTLADALAAHLKQPVVVDNKPGANAIVASELLTKAAPDGRTILVIINSHTINPAIVRKLPYDTLKDFTPIAGLAQTPYVVVASSGTGVKTLADLMAFARKGPGAPQFGYAEAGMRLTAARLGRTLGIPTTDVGYKGTGPMMTDMVGGHLNFSVTSVASTLPFRNSGKVNYVATTSQSRMPTVPEVPTLSEQGVQGFEASIWYAVVGPAGLPAELARDLNAAIRVAMATDEIKARLTTAAMLPWTVGPAELGAFLANDVQLNYRTAKDAGIEPE